MELRASDLKRYFLWKTSLCGSTAFRKGIASKLAWPIELHQDNRGCYIAINISLSGDNITTQVYTHCAFVIKTYKTLLTSVLINLYLLNSYKSAIQKSEIKNHKSMIFLE